MVGGVRGLAGLVIKPVAGALDIASTATEGLKNTMGMALKDLPYTRERAPRALYGTTSLVKPYNEYDA